MLNSDYCDMLSALIACKVHFLVIGAYALAGHGFPRATGDIDIWVEASPENAPKVISALATFGAPISDIDAEYFQTNENVFQIGVAPCRIDLLTSVTGLPDFAACHQRAHMVSMDKLEIPILSKADYITNKRALGRHRDLADIDTIEGRG
jgi:hypothetical protein